MSVPTKTDKIICPCGSSIKNASANIRQHQQSAKHQLYNKNKNVTEEITELKKKMLLTIKKWKLPAPLDPQMLSE